MKIYLKHNEPVLGMANLVPSRTGLSVTIWSDHGGVARSVSHHETPRVKIGTNNEWVSVTIESDPKIKAQSSNIKKKTMDGIKEGMDYVGKNFDLFRKHFYDTIGTFSDQKLKEALKDRGYYK